MRWYIGFDFDGGGEPPHIILGNEDYGQVIQVFEAPTLKPGRGEPSEWSESGLWSRDSDDWEPSPLALQLLEFLNSDAGQSKTP